MTEPHNTGVHDSNAQEARGAGATESGMGLTRLDRRSLLSWLARGSLVAAAAAAFGQVLRFLAYEPPSPASDIIPLGHLSDFPLDSVAYIAEARVYLGRDRGGLYAMDAVCTHLGCLVQQGENGGFVCPCHNSAFDNQGNALTGPATKPLRFLSVWLEEEPAQGFRLVVDRSNAVEPSTRLRV